MKSSSDLLQHSAKSTPQSQHCHLPWQLKLTAQCCLSCPLISHLESSLQESNHTRKRKSWMGGVKSLSSSGVMAHHLSPGNWACVDTSTQWPQCFRRLLPCAIPPALLQEVITSSTNATERSMCQLSIPRLAEQPSTACTQPQGMSCRAEELPSFHIITGQI